MPLPVCQTCAVRGVLCLACESKLASGAITEYDVEAARTLYGLIGAEADFLRAIDTESQVIIVAAAESIGNVIGKGGANLKALESRLGKHVKVVGRDDYHNMASALIAPARINGMNEVLRPGGGRGLRIRVDRSDRDRLRMPAEDLTRLIAAASECSVELVFD